MRHVPAIAFSRKGKTQLKSLSLVNGDVRRGECLLREGIFTAVNHDTCWTYSFFQNSEYHYEDTIHTGKLIEICGDLSSLIVDRSVNWEAEYSMRRIEETIDGLEGIVEIEEENEVLLLRFKRDVYPHAVVSFQVSGTQRSPINRDKVISLATEVNEALSVAETAISSYSGLMPIIFTGDASALLIHEVLGHMLEEPVTASNKQQFPIMQSTVRVSDLAGSEESYVQMIHDQEGSIARDILLIDGGKRVANMYTKMSSTALLSKVFTGHARATSIADLPITRIRNLELAKGELSYLGTVNSCRDGILVSRASSWAGVSLERNFFWIEIEAGRRIINGEVGQELTPLAITGSLRRLLETMVPLDDSLYTLSGFCLKNGQFVPVTTTTPSVFVSDAEVIALPRTT